MKIVLAFQFFQEYNRKCKKETQEIEEITMNKSMTLTASLAAATFAAVTTNATIDVDKLGNCYVVSSNPADVDAVITALKANGHPVKPALSSSHFRAPLCGGTCYITDRATEAAEDAADWDE